VKVSIGDDIHSLKFLEEVNDKNIKDALLFDIDGKTYAIH